MQNFAKSIKTIILGALLVVLFAGCGSTTVHECPDSGCGDEIPAIAADENDSSTPTPTATATPTPSPTVTPTPTATPTTSCDVNTTTSSSSDNKVEIDLSIDEFGVFVGEELKNNLGEYRDDVISLHLDVENLLAEGNEVALKIVVDFFVYDEDHKVVIRKTIHRDMVENYLTVNYNLVMEPKLAAGDYSIETHIFHVGDAIEEIDSINNRSANVGKNILFTIVDNKADAKADAKITRFIALEDNETNLGTVEIGDEFLFGYSAKNASDSVAYKKPVLHFCVAPADTPASEMNCKESQVLSTWQMADSLEPLEVFEDEEVAMEIPELPAGQYKFFVAVYTAGGTEDYNYANNSSANIGEVVKFTIKCEDDS